MNLKRLYENYEKMQWQNGWTMRQFWWAPDSVHGINPEMVSEREVHVTVLGHLLAEQQHNIGGFDLISLYPISSTQEN